MKKTPPKDIDSPARAQFIRSFGYPFIFFGIAGIIVGISTGRLFSCLLAAFVLSLIAALITTLITNQAGNMAGGVLFGAGRSTFSRRERLAGDMSQVRHHKMSGETGIALEKINALLKKDPDYAEAVFLRAQILMAQPEGRRKAVDDLKKVMELVPSPKESLHRWAHGLLADIYREKR